MKKSRKMVLLLLPFLIGYIFQATQYARAPLKYGYYLVYAKSADISLLPGTDLSPEDGDTLLRNATTQAGLYNLSLGAWAPGHNINYTDAFRIKNREAFSIKMITLNFSSDATGQKYLAIYLKNDTDGDGSPDGNWKAVWLGSETYSPGTGNQLNLTYHMFFPSDAELSVKVEIKLPETGLSINDFTPSLQYTGTMHMWFTSAEF